MILTKLQKEIYAAEVYRSIFDLENYEVIKFESPDFIVWLKNHKKIGLEVTIPSDQSQNELVKIANHQNRNILGKELGFEKHKKEGRILSSGVVIESASSNQIHEVILNIIASKFDRLNRNYTLFDLNVLCCLPICAFLYAIDDYEYFAKGLNELVHNYRFLFDEIIIIMHDKVIKFSLSNRQYVFDIVIELSNERSQSIQYDVSKLIK